MNAKQRLYARLAGKSVDKIPNLNIVMLFAAQHTGVKYGEFCQDYRKFVYAQGKTAEDFGIDILSTMSDAYRETYDFGAHIVFPEDDLPLCKGAVLREAADWRRLRHYDPMQSVRTLDRIKACELYKERYGEEYPILGWVEGCLAEFCDLTTLGAGMMMLIDEPDETKNAFEFLLQQQLESARVQISVGADFIGIGDAAASLISPATYREFVLPYETHLIKGIHDFGGKVKLHICGNINHILPDMVDTGADIVDIDYMVDLPHALRLAEGKCAICGNVNPAATILAGSAADVRRDTLRCLSEAADSSTYLFSGGCEIPRFTSEENVLEMDRVLREQSGT